MKDPAFLNVARSSLEKPREIGEATVKLLSGNSAFTVLADNLQNRSDRVYCDANQLDIQTGKKIQQAQPQQGVQQEAPQQGGPQA